jgi:hypothetical protein
MSEDAADKLKDLEAQARLVRAGFADSIQCPYCGLYNNGDPPICCQLYLKAMVAVCDRLDFEERAETADRIAQVIH